VEQTKANRNCLSVFVHSFPLSPSSARSAPDWLGWGISKSSSSLTHVCSLADSIHHTQGNIAFHLSGRCLISIRFLLAVCCWRWNDVTPLVTHTRIYENPCRETMRHPSRHLTTAGPSVTMRRRPSR
jgi:hypothetical protein